MQINCGTDVVTAQIFLCNSDIYFKTELCIIVFVVDVYFVVFINMMFDMLICVM